MTRTLVSTALVLSLVAFACNPYGPDDGADTTSSGQCTHDDATTTTGGAPAEPATPPEQDGMEIELTVNGRGSLSGLDPSCLDGVAGNFKGLLEGEGSIDGNGVYLAGLFAGEGAFSTPSGCKIPDIAVASMLNAKLRAKLQNTTQNCNTHCAAKGRAKAEGECAGDGYWQNGFATEASCRTEMGADFTAECKTVCSGKTTRRIVAETSLSVAQLTQATLSSQQLGAEHMGNLTVNFKFDRIEEQDGTVVHQ